MELQQQFGHEDINKIRPVQPASRAVTPTEIKSIGEFDAILQRCRFEDQHECNLINHRFTWLILSQSFLLLVFVNTLAIWPQGGSYYLFVSIAITKTAMLATVAGIGFKSVNVFALAVHQAEKIISRYHATEAMLMELIFGTPNEMLNEFCLPSDEDSADEIRRLARFRFLDRNYKYNRVEQPADGRLVGYYMDSEGDTAHLDSFISHEKFSAAIRILWKVFAAAAAVSIAAIVLFR